MTMREDTTTAATIAPVGTPRAGLSCEIRGMTVDDDPVVTVVDDLAFFVVELFGLAAGEDDLAAAVVEASDSPPTGLFTPTVVFATLVDVALVAPVGAAGFATLTVEVGGGAIAFHRLAKE